MQLFTLLIAVLLSCFSTAVMSYISMATGIGPWIEMTLVLVGMLIFYGMRHRYASTSSKALGCVVAAGGIGGIVATACGFVFPTLYFLDPVGFSELFHRPVHFASLLTGMTLAAGSFGLVIAHYFGPPLLDREDLTFPIGELTYKMIMAADNLKKAAQLATGFIGTQIYLIFQWLIPYLSQPLILMQRFSYSAFTVPDIVFPLDQLPMFLAIGFVTGHVIALPLFVGLLSRLLVIDPLHYLYPRFYQWLFSAALGPLTGMTYVPKTLTITDFTIAFCSGLVIYGATKGFFGLPRVLKTAYQKLFEEKDERSAIQAVPWLLVGTVLAVNVVVLSSLSLSVLAQVYLLLFSLICTYQLMIIAGKFGLAPLGRFATFVMVPGMILFGYTPLQTTCVALYVEIAGGVACDALFGRKMAQLLSIEKRSIARYQWLGLIACALVIGLFIFIYIKQFGLGSEYGALAATRGASRALLISVKSFDIIVLLFGVLFGFLISYLRINTTLLLGGILMPISYTLMLVAGGVSTYCVEDREDYYPFWSGVFASSSIWMLVRAFF